MKIEAIDLPTHGVEDLKKVLNGLEVKLSDAKERRDKISLDVRRACAASDAGDQRQRLALGGLNKNSDAAGREVLSLEAQVAEARKRLAMAMNQVAVIEARSHAMAAPRDEAAGQTESGLVSRVPPKAKDRRGLWALHPWGLAPVKAAGRYVDVLPRRKSLNGTGIMARAMNSTPAASNDK